MKEIMPKERIWIIILFSLLFIAIIFLVVNNYQKETDVQEISSFQECEEAGYPIMESYPRQCRVPGGELFVEEIDDEIDSSNNEEFYGSSTNYSCEVDEDCLVSGCNSEICQGAEEESMSSICIFPDEPLPKDLGYSCGCFEGQCQWGR
jgi:eight-cysteine-cluster-containing protein